MHNSESTLYSLLTDTDALDYLIKQGFLREEVLEIIPLEVGREVVKWAIDFYFTSGRKIAPSKEAIMETWGDKLAPHEVVIDNSDIQQDTIQWVVAELRSRYAQHMASSFANLLVTDVTNANGPDRAATLIQYSGVLHTITQQIVDRQNERLAADGIEDTLKRYDEVAAEGRKFYGMTLGLQAATPDIITLDQYIMGIHPGEMAVLAGTSGGGKSWFSLMPLLSEFKNDRKAVLYTIENDLELTYDRLACMHCRVDYEKLQRGQCDEGDLIRIRDFKDQLSKSDKQPLIIHPGRNDATGANMIRRALSEGADSVIIDQLSHIQPVAGSKARDRNRVVAEIVQDLTFLIKEGSEKVPLLLMHQINRAGRAEARKTGRYEMSHLGEATQVENESTFIWAIYQSSQHIAEERAELQCLKSRRIAPKEWEIEWRPYVGDYRIRRELDKE